MPNQQQIRKQIASVKKTRQITFAMQVIASTKMSAARRRLESFRAYGLSVRAVAARLAAADPTYKPPLMVRRTPVKTVGLIVVTTDKGLCGGLNNGLLHASLLRMKVWEDAGMPVKMTIIGSKGYAFMQRYGADIVSRAVQLGELPAFDKLLGAVTAQLLLYIDGQIDELYIASNAFINAMKYTPRIERLLPLDAPGSVLDAPPSGPAPDYEYEPSTHQVLDDLLLRYVESMIYQAVVENAASEQSARMIAMKAATDNADEVVREMTLDYNKKRQAAITEEISEIVNGAAAV